MGSGRPCRPFISTSRRLRRAAGAAVGVVIPSTSIRPLPKLAGGGGGRFAAARSRIYDKQIAELNEIPSRSAHRYKQAKDAKAPGFRTDLKLEAMIPVIEGKEPVLITARREREIRDAITWADKQKVKIILVDAIEAMKAAKEINGPQYFRDSGPSLSLPRGPDDRLR